MDFATFIQACELGNSTLVGEGLLSPKKIDLRQTDDSGQTPLMAAARHNHMDVVRVLLDAGSDAQQSCAGGYDALRWSVYNRNIEMAKQLVPGSDLQKVDVTGHTVLMTAIRNGCVEIAKVLIAGSALRQIDRHDRSSLMHAAMQGEVDLVRLLLKGSDLQQKDIEGQTALQLALSEEHWTCVDLLACADPGFDGLTWPAQARPEDLPQWFARMEKQVLEQIIASSNTPNEPRKRKELRRLRV